MPAPKYDWTSGTRFKMLILTGKSCIENGSRKVECICDCGKIKWVDFSSIKKGKIHSCGCLRMKMFIEMAVVHSLYKHPLYTAYHSMLQRCTNESHPNYEDYGGRGITVCSEWGNSFQVFYNWAIANGYMDGKSLDREENDGIYEPANCRWVNQAQQNRNKRTTFSITGFGETKCLQDWAKDSRCGIGKTCLRYRLKRGWSLEKAFSVPLFKREK